MKLVPCAGNLTYYASIMLDAFHAYYAQNYAGIIGTSLIPSATDMFTTNYLSLTLLSYHIHVHICEWILETISITQLYLVGFGTTTLEIS